MSASSKIRLPAELRARMNALGLREEDLQEEFVLSSGPGGQNVNKTATCVLLIHLPSGEQVKCQEQRTQAGNRRRAREILAERFAGQREAEKKKRAAEAARRRARKRRRSRSGKEKMLEQKRQRSQKKQSRQRIRPREIS
ncbi:MAG: peptide chain release factor family protein [Candidatus Omnitrophota bacterium]